MHKKTFIVTGLLLVLAAGILAYHFYAAASAEETLDNTIRELSGRADTTLSINYSGIEVSPFSGDIRISDITVIRSQNIQRASRADLDLGYADFLNFMIWGAEAGLKRVTSGKLIIGDLSYTNRSSFTEVKLDSLSVDYSGNLWNLIVLGVTGGNAQIEHTFRAVGNRFRYYQPESTAGAVTADSLHLNLLFGSHGSTSSFTNRVRLRHITWNPPENIQEKYRFFIQGFGYETDAIPFRELLADVEYGSGTGIVNLSEIKITSELFTIALEGELLLHANELSRSELRNTSVRLYEMSSRFQNVLQQIGKLTGLKFPEAGEQMQVRVKGPLTAPDFEF
ncbi:MAG: hypothetical protein R3281_03445 [Balneolaceae bacterium]|nr:hypothetical protein [Balneolaceae bacterium]